MKKLNREEYYILLTTIDNDGDLSDLLGLQINYAEINFLLKNELELGNIKFENKKLILSEKGVNLRDELLQNSSFGGITKVVQPRISSKLKNKLKPEDVFIPDTNEIDF